MRGLVDDNGEIIKTDEENHLQSKIAEHKKSFQAQYNELKDQKSEIERIQNLLERCREKMQRDFEQWLQVMIRQKSLEQKSSVSGGLNATSSSQGMAQMQMPADKKV